jgi:hypothetical protein
MARNKEQNREQGFLRDHVAGHLFLRDPGLLVAAVPQSRVEKDTIMITYCRCFSQLSSNRTGWDEKVQPPAIFSRLTRPMEDQEKCSAPVHF